MTTSDGSTADYYELPAGATQLQDLISHRDMNAQLGEIFRAAYRYGMASHSGKLRDAKKIKFYIDAEIKRLEVLLAKAKVDGCCETIDPADVEIASEIEDDSERMQAIGQNGEMASEVYAAVDQNAWANCELESLTSESRKHANEDKDGVFWSERGRAFNMNRWRVLRWIK